VGVTSIFKTARSQNDRNQGLRALIALDISVMGAMIMFGLIIAIALVGTAYFYHQDRKEEKRQGASRKGEAH